MVPAKKGGGKNCILSLAICLPARFLGEPSGPKFYSQGLE
jgi:hypothetical protein